MDTQLLKLVMFERGQNIVKNRRGGRSAPTTVNSSVRTREYLTTAEIERLMAAARKSSRHGHRDATMILIGYRHGLRASELCDLLTASPLGFPHPDHRWAVRILDLDPIPRMWPHGTTGSIAE